MISRKSFSIFFFKSLFKNLIFFIFKILLCPLLKISILSNETKLFPFKGSEIFFLTFSDELEEFFLALDTLEIQDSLKANLITELEHTIKLYELLIEQDSLVIMYKDEEIILLNEQIELHLNYIDSQDKWYNKPLVSAAAGVLGTILLIQTLDYTLPD